MKPSAFRLLASAFLSSAYNWTYALMQMPIGALLDRFGVRRVGRLSTAVWSAASFGAAVSTGLGGFVAARFLLGVGEAPTFPANAKALGYWFPQSERSLATAITDSAAKFSTAIGVPILGVLLLRFGWRWSFAFTGFVSFFYFLLFLLDLPKPERRQKTLRRRTGIHCSRWRAARGQSHCPQRSAHRLFAASAESLRPWTGVGSL